MSFEGVWNETKLEFLAAVYDFPSATLECEAGDNILSQSVLREASDVSDCPAAEHDAGAGYPCTVHAISLDLIELAIDVETLVKWIVGRHVIESLSTTMCQLES
jgi:hypothetical protein